MQPIRFNEANGTLGGGPAEVYGTGDDVVDLPVHRSGMVITSCWAPTWRDRLRLLFGGKVWLKVLAQRTHAPVNVDTEFPFQEASPDA